MRTDPLEKEIQKAIVDFLTISGVWVWRANRGAMVGEYKGKKRFVRFGVTGMSDLMGIFEGRLLAIEVKRPGKKPTDDQQGFLDRVNSEGGIGFCATSLDQVIEWHERSRATV